MHSGVPRGTEIGPRLFLLFVNELSDALEALTLLFPDDVKVVTWRPLNMTFTFTLTAAWDRTKKWDLPTTKYFFTGFS